MDARLVWHHGAWTVSIDETLYPFTAYKPTEEADAAVFAETVRRSVADMAARGVHLHFVPVRFEWPGPGEYDFSNVDLRVGQVLEADPEARVVIRINVPALNPAWWREAHPEGVLTYGFGDGAGPGVEEGPVDQLHRFVTQPCPSLGSDFWPEHGIPALVALARHVAAQSYAPRVAGYMPGAQNSSEWFLRSYTDLRVGDLCPAMRDAFRAHLREEYGMEWDGGVPGRASRGAGDNGFLFDPDPRTARSPVVAYYRFASRLCADVLLGITRALRATCAPDRHLIGFFYGYQQGMANFYWLPEMAHLAQGRVLDAEERPDFLSSPHEYFTRNENERPAGGFVWSQGTAPDAARLAGSVYFGEEDFCPPDRGPDWFQKAKDPARDRQNTMRNTVFSLCKGTMHWWYDLPGHWFEGPERLAAVADCVRVARRAMEKDRTPNSQVLVVMDEEASFHVALDLRFQRALFWENFYHSFAQIGAPVDLVTLSDLKRVDPAGYRAVFFPTCYAPTAEDRARIEAFKGDGRALVFYHADGYIRPDGEPRFDPEGMRELSGIRTRAQQGLQQMRCSPEVSHPLLAGLSDACFGVHTEKIPAFAVEDPEAETLGRYSAGGGPVAFARKPMDGWTSYYTAVPKLPGPVVRRILAEAGGHLYLEEEDILYANTSYVGIYTHAGGSRTVRLPGPRKVVEAFTESVVAASPTDAFVFEAEPYHAYLFELEA